MLIFSIDMDLPFTSVCQIVIQVDIVMHLSNLYINIKVDLPKRLQTFSVILFYLPTSIVNIAQGWNLHCFLLTIGRVHNLSFL